MNRTRVLLGLAICLTTTVAHGASVLCKTRRGGLVIRETCKLTETLLDAPALGQLGLRGPAGPTGPVGPAGGGLKVLDVNSSEVGLVLSVGSYYGQYATVTRQMSLPGGTGPEIVVFSVTPSGLRTSSYACSTYYGAYFRSPDCTGPLLQRCEYGNCSTGGAFLFTSLQPGSDGVACFTRPGVSFERGDFYHQFSVQGPSILAATQACTVGGGSLPVAPTPCPFNPLQFCGQCCALEQQVGVVPRQSVDLSGVGTPPFRLGR